MTTRRPFFYDQVIGEFHQSITLKRNHDADELATELRKVVDEEAADGYAESLQYTASLEFEWREDCPPEYREFEIWWGMTQNKKVTPKDAYLYFLEHVPLDLFSQWRLATTRAFRVWKPVEEVMDENLPEDVDPEDPKE